MQPNPLIMAQESIRLGEKTDNRLLRMLGTGTLVATSLLTFAVTLFHSVRSLARDWRHDHSRDRRAPARADVRDIDYDSDGTYSNEANTNWARREERSGREPKASHADAVHRNQHATHHR
jgi:hypothetical protein